MLSGAIIYVVATGTGIVSVFYLIIDTIINSYDVSLILFFCMVGILVAMITKGGGSYAYGKWASSKLKSRNAAAIATSGLGLLIFLDDYFNCITVGTVMRPVTDNFKISRERLAYIIDSTAAPICVIAPISSWAASVVSYYPVTAEQTGLQAFVSAIPMNFYAILTLFMAAWIFLRKNSDFGPMAKAEWKAMHGDLGMNDDLSQSAIQDELSKFKISKNGKVMDLIIPIVILIISSILSMLYIGGYWDGSGMTIFEAFGNTSSGPALALGTLSAMVFTAFLYIPRKVLSYKSFFESTYDGIKVMIPSCTICVLAWGISAVCNGLLGTGEFVSTAFANAGFSITLIPAAVFLVSCFLSFSTGTSWGTFGIMIPIVVTITNAVAPSMSVTALSAVLAGSVFGDHCSPISDTTILASAGANISHLRHVATQVPYALLVGSCSLVGYIVAGATNFLGFKTSLVISLVVSFSLLIISLITLPKLSGIQSFADYDENFEDSLVEEVVS